SVAPAGAALCPHAESAPAPTAPAATAAEPRSRRRRVRPGRWGCARCVGSIIWGTSLDPAETDGVDDLLREQREEDQHGCGCDQGRRHQPGPVGPGARRL